MFNINSILPDTHLEPRVPLMKMSPLRSHLRATNQLQEFLKDHQLDAFSRRYAQCYPSNLASLKPGKAVVRLYNFMDVSAFKQCKITSVIDIIYNKSSWAHFPKSTLQ